MTETISLLRGNPFLRSLQKSTRGSPGEPGLPREVSLRINPDGRSDLNRFRP
jgi:hypothetical protein